MQGFGPASYGDGFADVYDDWYGTITDAVATAAFVAERRGPGPVLELGVGSGRLVPALVERGCDVIGIDASAAMLRRCATVVADAGLASSVSLIRADLGRLPTVGRPRIGAALCAFNTLFNLPTAAQQQELMRRLAAALDPRGAVVIEAITGSSLAEGPASSVGVSRLSAEQLVLSATVLDPERQTIEGQHIDITEAGIRMRPWMLRWTTPDQLDEMAEVAGLELAERFAGWDGATYGPDADTHVSVYRPAR